MGSTVSEPSSACRQDGKTQTTGAPQPTRQKSNPSQSHPTSKIFDDASTIAGYQSVPLIDIDVLPRGGISFETKAVGRIQFGIPPETIKDSMIFGMEVPSVYIIPIERFCRELGPALGLNMAEFEFPAYFNYFVRGKKVQLVVESADAENDIRNVFGETLLGPECFRDDRIPCANVDEDFDPSFPKDCRPDFYKEFRHFRTSEKTEEYPELCIDTLLDFVHFSRDRATDRESNNILGVPPTLPEFEVTSDHNHLDVKMADCGVPRTMTATMSEKVETDKPPLPGPPSGGMRRNSTSAGQVLLKGTVQSYWNGDDSFSDPKSMHDIPIGNLKRSSSDSTLSSNHSHSSEKQRRRGSAEWIKDSADESFLSPRQNLLEAVQTLSSPMRNFGLLDRSIKIRESSKRDSLNSLASIDSDQPNNVLGRRFSRIFMMSTGTAANALGYEFMEEGDDLRQRHWMYSQAKWLGDVATIYPPHVKTASERKSKCARVEIFRMAGGTEYIVHDIDENNVIIGKTRFSGTVRVPDELSVQGFLSSIDNMSSLISSRTEIGKSTILGPDNGSVDATFAMSSRIAPTPKFFPPSFGVTVLGNSHGFDKNGATSGYVLWINGRGIMIDPPPFSSSTLEREGIRPQMITAIIITHCHADHDAGAFQKIMTGSRVAIITTPTIYRSFLRKYSALSGLRPSLLRHSHRHRPAIIGQPLRFQGAIFHFTYTLHTIPCISFKVEWRGRSIVFTGDHMNIPEQIDRLEREVSLLHSQFGP
jgi:glyoxylase-like metal-dependent hydrolase (beta-lactamase superfamily II)